MTRKCFLICALLAVISAACDAQSRSKTFPSQFVDWLATPGMRHATVGVEIVDLTTGETLYVMDEQRAVQPASLLKLVTTGAALRLLGGDYVIPDTICQTDTTLAPLPQLIGYSPDWMIEDVESWYVAPLDTVPDAGIELREYIKRTNEKSLNVHAEALPYLLTPEGTLPAGLHAIKAYWDSCGIDTTALVMYDGCGLAPADRVTTHLISQLLAEMQHDEDFRNSFAVAGKTGTVNYFLRASYLSGRAQLKTGTTKSVVAYAGYVRGSNNHTYSVVLIVNNSTDQLTLMRKNIEKMFILLIP